MGLKPVVIYNPAAGKGHAAQILPEVQKRLSEHGIDHDLWLTTGPGNGREMARQAVVEQRPLVIAAGGDGTINEVINGLMEGRGDGKNLPALGVLPIGRGNDFAYGVNIPLALDTAVDVLAQGCRRRIDVGRVTGGDFPEGRYFGNGVGLGFDTVVGFEAAKITWLHGAASYLVALGRTIFLYAKAPVYEVQIDEDSPMKQAYLMISIMNGSRMGGTFHMAPQSDPGDQTFDLCLANEVPQWKILPLAAKFINGTQQSHPAILMTRAKKIVIRAVEGSIPAHADGETICTAGSQLLVEIVPSALEVVIQER